MSGKAWIYGGIGAYSGVFASSPVTSNREGQRVSTGAYGGDLIFKASDSNNIYGKTTRIQPRSFYALMIIKA